MDVPGQIGYHGLLILQALYIPVSFQSFYITVPILQVYIFQFFLIRFSDFLICDQIFARTKVLIASFLPHRQKQIQDLHNCHGGNP